MDNFSYPPRKMPAVQVCCADLKAKTQLPSMGLNQNITDPPKIKAWGMVRLGSAI